MMSPNSGAERREAAVRLINRYEHGLIKQLFTLMKPSSDISSSPLPLPCICELAVTAG